LLFMGFYQRQQNMLALLSQRLTGAARQQLEREPGRLLLLGQRLTSSCGQRIEREHHRIELLKQRFDSLDPKLLLRRGYTITTCGGKLVRSIEGLAEGEVLTTQTEEGNIYSIVKVVKKLSR